jgi:hypothetical protein
MDTLDTLLIINENGEVRYHGPKYVCTHHGLPGHDQFTCVVCKANYEKYLFTLRQKEE